MAISPTLPGGWEPIYGSQPSGYSSLTPADRLVWEAAAADLLNNWTGNVFGLTEITLAPYRRERFSDTYSGGRRRVPGGWYARPEYRLACGNCGSWECGGHRLTSVILPGRVHSIREVQVAGAVLPPTSYEERRGCLIRLDGQEWPSNALLGDSEAPAWQVTYTRGVPLPEGGALALGVLAVELWKANAGDRSCALPQRVTSVTREGVSMTILDAFEGLEEGRTGIWTIDSWVASVQRRRLPSTVRFPGAPAAGAIR